MQGRVDLDLFVGLRLWTRFPFSKMRLVEVLETRSPDDPLGRFGKTPEEGGRRKS